MLNGAVQQHHQLQQFSEETLAPSAGVLAWKQHGGADGNISYFRNGRAWWTNSYNLQTKNSSHNLTIQLVWDHKDIQSQQKGLIDRVFNGVVIHLIKSWWSYLPFFSDNNLLVPKAEWSGNGEAELLKNFKLSERSLEGGGGSCRPILQEDSHKKSFWKSPERRPV